MLPSALGHTLVLLSHKPYYYYYLHLLTNFCIFIVEVATKQNKHTHTHTHRLLTKFLGPIIHHLFWQQKQTNKHPHIKE
jgi:hypothetical protein